MSLIDLSNVQINGFIVIFRKKFNISWKS